MLGSASELFCLPPPSLLLLSPAWHVEIISLTKYKTENSKKFRNWRVRYNFNFVYIHRKVHKFLFPQMLWKGTAAFTCPEITKSAFVISSVPKKLCISRLLLRQGWKGVQGADTAHVLVWGTGESAWHVALGCSKVEQPCSNVAVLKLCTTGQIWPTK